MTVAESVTESQSVVANPDGSFTAKIHGGPARFRNAQGDWVDVDLTLYRRPDGSVAPRAHPRGLVLAGASGAGSHDLVRFVTRGHEIAVGWPGALPAPSLSGTKATYAEVLPGVDVVVEATRIGFEYFMVVKSRAAARRVAQVSLPWRAEGLSAVHTGEGSVQLRDPAGAVVAWAPAATMWDARVSPGSGDPVVQKPVKVSVKRAAEGRSTGMLSADVASTDVMQLLPDKAFLDDPKAVYPITIDPAVTEKSEFDTFTQNSYTSDQSAATLLKLGYVVDGGSYYARSHLRYDGLTGYAKANVVAATLYLWNNHSFSCRANNWQVWRTDNVTSSVRYTNPPARRSLNGTSSLTKGYNSSCGEGYVANNVKEAFQTAFSNSWSSVSLELAAQSTTSQDSWKKFDSMEAAHDPYVALDYNRPPAAPTGLLVGGKACATGAARPTIATIGGPPQLQANVSDPDSAAEAISLDARFYVAELGAPLPGTSTVISPSVTQPKGGAAQTATAMLPVSFVLQEFHTYYFQVKGYDQENEGAWSAICEFYVDNGNPEAEPQVEALDVLPGTSTKVYPENGTGGGPGVSSRFRFSANGEPDITRYRYKYTYKQGTATNWVEVAAPSLSAPVEVVLAPPFDDGSGPDAGHLGHINMGGQWVITVEMADSANPPRWSQKQKVYTTNVASAPAALAHWKMNDPGTAATLADETGRFPVTRSGAMSKQANGFGDFGSAWSFDGWSGRASTAGPVLVTDRSFSVSAWVRLTDGGTFRTAVAQCGSGTVCQFYLQYAPEPINRWRFVLTSGESAGRSYYDVYSDEPAQLGEWTHLVGVYDAEAGQVRLYVNGTRQTWGTGGATGATWAAGGPLWMGDAGASGNNMFPGDIDEVAVWQRALDPREIGALAVAEVASWDLDTVLTDAAAKPISAGPPFDLQGTVDTERQGSGNPLADDPLWWTSGHPVHVGGEAGEDGGATRLNWSAEVPKTLSLTTDRPVVRTDESYSVSLWVRPEELWNNSAISQQGVSESGFWLKYDPASHRWMMAIADEDNTGTGYATVTSDNLAEAGKWTHLVGVYDAAANKILLYVNGVLEGTAPVTFTPMRATGPLAIGNTRWQNQLMDYWVGAVDEIRVFQGVLTPDMVDRLDGVLVGHSGDGKADIAWYDASKNDGQLDVLMTNSAGTGPSVLQPFASGYSPPDWAGVGDFNGDGRADIAWYHESTGAVRVSFSNGSGMGSSVEWVSGFGRPDWAGVGDFNGDGKDDLAWYHTWKNGGEIDTLITGSDGAGPSVLETFVQGYGPPDWAGVGDFNGDGRADIAWYEEWKDRTITLNFSDAAGAMESSADWSSGHDRPDWASTGDYNGDGKADIAWYHASRNDGEIKVLVTDSAGTGPSGMQPFASGYGMPGWAGVGDFNGDGRDDIAWYVEWQNGTVTVGFADSSGSRGSSVAWVSGWNKPDWASVT
ncbi:hypothetical protein CS0771_21320 [Catellatospora sp. IY07-71]|nr:hypothetical protein CS0771_21320 [Catellatospora sp. IY07-71]